MKPLTDCFLYAFIDTAYLYGRSIGELSRQLCAGGADLIQIRAKNSNPDQILHMAEEILPIAQKAHVGLVINDFPDIALQIGAPYCHLGQEDFFDKGYQSVSQLYPLPGSPAVGLSSHKPDQALRAIKAGADYLGVGPVFPTATKPEAQAATLDYVRWASEHIPIPWFAIGGIQLKNLDEVLNAGARRICVVSAILQSRDIAKTCLEFKKKLETKK